MIKNVFICIFLQFLGLSAFAQNRDVVGIITRQHSSITIAQILIAEARTHYLGKKCDLVASVNIVEIKKELKIKDVSVSAGSCFGFDPKKYFWNENASQQRGLPFALYKTKSGYALPAGLELILSANPSEESDTLPALVPPILN